MNLPEDSERPLEAFLQRLRKRLRGLRDEEIADILRELRGHVLERAAAGGEPTPSAVESVLAALGTPEELAALYLTDELMAQAEVSRSPRLIWKSLARWASLSVAGALVLLGALGAYLVAAVFVVVALLKPIHPHAAGLWVSSGGAGTLTLDLRLGFETAPAAGHELLGWWIVPLGLIVGYGLFLSTTRLMLWALRRRRAARRLPPC